MFLLLLLLVFFSSCFASFFFVVVVSDIIVNIVLVLLVSAAYDVVDTSALPLLPVHLYAHNIAVSASSTTCVTKYCLVFQRLK